MSLKALELQLFAATPSNPATEEHQFKVKTKTPLISIRS